MIPEKANTNPIIRVEKLTKTFKLPYEKSISIKSKLINFHKRSKGYEIQKALNNISFQIEHGEFFGIVGRNGSGKSTMLKMLAGIYVPTSGNISISGSLTPFIELGVGFNDELTGRENVFLNGALLGFDRKQMQAIYKEIVEFAELEKFMEQKLKNYSSGMRVRLAFSLAIRAQTDILLVDEVLAVGDADFQRKCFEYFKELKKNKKTVVFVSHDMGAVKEFCDKGILIEEGQIKIAGTADEVAREYSKMFIEGEEEPEQSIKTTPKMRYGNGDIIIKKVKVVVGENDIRVLVEAKAKKDIESLIYGIHFSGQDGVEITAMNNRMINVPDVESIKAESVIKFEWKVQNIFADGKYYIMLTMVDGTYTKLDYLEDAASFRVKRENRSNTSVIPPVEVTVDR